MFSSSVFFLAMDILYAVGTCVQREGPKREPLHEVRANHRIAGDRNGARTASRDKRLIRLRGSIRQCGALVRVDFVRARETYLRDL